MQHDAGTLRTDDGLTLATRRWTPHARPKAAVVIVHGIGEHSGRYAHVAAHLLLHDYAVYAFDLRGHGRSEGHPRVYVASFDEYVSDLDCFLADVRKEHRGPLFLLGHSMGGGIAALYVIERGTDGLAGLVLSSAALQIPADLSPLLQKAAGVLSRFLRLRDIQFVVIEQDYPTVAALRSQGLQVLHGHGEDPDLLRRAGIRDARMLLVTAIERRS